MQGLCQFGYYDYPSYFVAKMHTHFSFMMVKHGIILLNQQVNSPNKTKDFIKLLTSKARFKKTSIFYFFRELDCPLVG
jgi:hypothetical protein